MQAGVPSIPSRFRTGFLSPIERCVCPLGEEAGSHEPMVVRT